MFWLAVSPDGLVLDHSKNQIRLLEIKCPYTRRNATSRELVKDENFYVELLDGKFVLKKDHHNGYYSQIQLAMGLCGIDCCDFVVYTVKRLIIANCSD